MNCCWTVTFVIVVDCKQQLVLSLLLIVHQFAQSLKILQNEETILWSIYKVLSIHNCSCTSCINHQNDLSNTQIAQLTVAYRQQFSPIYIPVRLALIVRISNLQVYDECNKCITGSLRTSHTFTSSEEWENPSGTHWHISVQSGRINENAVVMWLNPNNVPDMSTRQNHVKLSSSSHWHVSYLTEVSFSTDLTQDLHMYEPARSKTSMVLGNTPATIYLL